MPTVQVWLDDNLFLAVAREAKKAGQSVGVYVREVVRSEVKP